MNISKYSRKDIGNLGEKMAVEYLRRRGCSIIGRNISRLTGELDIVAKKGNVLHIVEVKAMRCKELPSKDLMPSTYHPANNLHSYKIRKVARTAEWYVLNKGWKGEWQIDGALVWLREHDSVAYVQYYPQIL